MLGRCELSCEHDNRMLVAIQGTNSRRVIRNYAPCSWLNNADCLGNRNPEGSILIPS